MDSSPLFFDTHIGLAVVGIDRQTSCRRRLLTEKPVGAHEPVAIMSDVRLAATMVWRPVVKLIVVSLS